MKLSVCFPAVAAILFCTGCASPQEHYYTLVPVAALVPAASPAALRTLVVEPAVFPEALDRPQLVVGVAPQQRVLLEQERWVEPLPEDLQRALALSLSTALPEVAVRLAGDPGVAGDAPHLSVQVRRFDLTPGDGARLDAHWTILGAGKAVLHEGDFVQVTPVAGARSYGALVQAQAAAVAALARQLARVIN